MVLCVLPLGHEYSVGQWRMTVVECQAAVPYRPFEDRAQAQKVG
jgi:hypothetical protein